MKRYEEDHVGGRPVPADEAAIAGDGGGAVEVELWALLRPALPGLIRTIRAWFDEVSVSNQAAPLAVWLLWVEALLMLTPAEAAERVGVSLSLIYQLCTEKRLPHYRIGGDGRRGKLLIDEADLAAFLAACRVDADGLDESEPLKHIR
jgi:excisionase family DNA binding protein